MKKNGQLRNLHRFPSCPNSAQNQKSGSDSMLIPADRSGIQIDIDLLDLLILFQSVHAKLTAGVYSDREDQSSRSISPSLTDG